LTQYIHSAGLAFRLCSAFASLVRRAWRRDRLGALLRHGRRDSLRPSSGRGSGPLAFWTFWADERW